MPQLIGFGKGLTPDGDDYLLGYLAALWLWQLPAPLADHQYRLQQAIDQHAHNTTDISRHYLERALQGHFSEPICQLLAQLVGSASAMTIASCAEQVMQFGATSGSRLPCRNAAWLSNPEHHELISTFSPVARLWGYTGMLLPEFCYRAE